MSRLSLLTRAAAIVSIAVIFSNVWSALQPDSTAVQSAALESSRLFKSAANGCSAQVASFDPAPGAAKDIVATGNMSPICTYLEKCCADNANNAQRCCGVLA